MEYTKQAWTAPTGTGLSRYAKSAESASHVTLTLDPENLTNTPTPFTMARMAHMEDGIAKAYDTAPPTPWAQYSGKDIPQLPDNLAGTTYKRDNDWTTTDGWFAQSIGTLSVTDNHLVWVPALNTQDMFLVGALNTTAYVNKVFIVKVKYSPNISSIKYRNTTGYIDMKMHIVGGSIFAYAFPESTLANRSYLNINFTDNTDGVEIESIYIGTGAYDRLIFDNSYHYRHLLNNAVVPTPQGLYFNGATSYLRSKEMVTLPDVFTFSATVNCASSSTTGMIYYFRGDSDAEGLVAVYRIINSNSLGFLYYNTNTAALVTLTIGTNLFTGYENKDVNIKTEIDFINKKVSVFRENVLFLETSAPYILQPTSTVNMWIGMNYTYTSPFLGYMRNIQLYDTALTDTQRNWLAQGNTPPILYDVTNYELEGYVSIQDADGTNTGVETDVDSNGNRILKLPATIKANVTGNADTASKANVRVSLRHGNTFFAKTWTGLTDFFGNGIWTDGENIYFNEITNSFVLNKTTFAWVSKTLSGITNIVGDRIWTDGENIYCSTGIAQYILLQATSTWVAKTWTGLTNFNGKDVWTDGDNIYYSAGITHYVLNKETSTWIPKTWTGLTDFNGNNVWTDGENIYHSEGANQHVLNKATNKWVVKTWAGLTNFDGDDIWKDGENIYYSNETTQRVLNKLTDTWVPKIWEGLTDFFGRGIWTDGENIYYSSGTTHYVLPATRHNYVDDNKYNSLFGTVTTCNCSTLSDKFVFSNE